MEETEILPDMLVNFKDFAVEIHFVVANLFRGMCDIFHKDHKLIGSWSFNFPFNSLQWSDKYCRSPLDTFYILLCFLKLT